MIATETMGMTAANAAPESLPIERDSIFTDRQGRMKPRVEKRQRKLLAKVAPFLDAFLAPEEKIRLVTTGCSPFGLLEQLTTGWIITYVKRSLFVFTDRRILHIPTRSDYSYRNSIAQIPYDGCASIRLRGSRLTVRYRGGRKETFLYVARAERGKIKSLLERLSLGGAASGVGERTHLCPSCTQPLRPDIYHCPRCFLAFKNADEARRISLLYPGGGYFYTGHPWLGLADAATESSLMLMTAVLLWHWATGVKGAGAQAVVFAVILALEKVVTVYHAGHFIREFIPKEKKLTSAPVLAGGRA